ncbi:MAG: flagellar protein FlaG [Proteobacteria bacterium]|nr:flagellar protein FlaG [Pseudomonadota bacterium]
MMEISNVSNISYGPGVQTDAPVPRVKSSSSDSSVQTSGNGSVDPVALRAATDKINQTMQGLGNNLEFTVDTETSMNIVKVVDKATNKTIRQFPSAEALAIAKTLDKLQGLLIREKA